VDVFLVELVLSAFATVINVPRLAVNSQENERGYPVPSFIEFGVVGVHDALLFAPEQRFSVSDDVLCFSRLLSLCTFGTHTYLPTLKTELYTGNRRSTRRRPVSSMGLTDQ
jgi:hypothetical protein